MAVAKACVFISNDPHGRMLDWKPLFLFQWGRINRFELFFKRLLLKWVYSLFFLE
jgi:hypothetical protein